MLPRVLHRFGIDVSADDAELTAFVNDGLSMIGGALAIYGRAKAHRPISTGTVRDAAGPVMLIVYLGLWVLLFSGCAQNGPRLSDSIESVSGSFSYSDGKQSVGVGSTIKLRDRRGFAK